MVLHLAARSLSNEPPVLDWSEEELCALDWASVYKECVYQAIALAAFDQLLPYKKYLSQEVYTQWKTVALQLVRNNVRLTQAQAELTGILEAYKQTYVIIKGTATSAYYPNPNLRSLGDIDFYIDREKQAETERVLRENGYQKSDEWQAYHVNFEKDDVGIEMHFDLPGMPEGEQGERLRAFFEPIFTDSMQRKEEESYYRAPDDKCHGVIVLLHLLAHNIGYGVGVRHLCDWAAYVQATREKGYWQETLLPLFKEVGIYRYAAVVTKMSALYLGITCPDWAINVDEELCGELLEDMFTAGNMGQKDRNYSKSAQLIEKKDGKKRGAFATLLHSLHVSILQRYPIVKKVWILYPFVFVWKVVKNLFLMCIGKRASIAKTLPEAKKRKQIYDKMKIFEPQGEEK